MSIAVPDPTVHSAYKSGALALIVAASAILTALGFEYIGGLAPCHLCLQERYAYYAGVPVLFAALVLLSSGQRRFAAVLFFLAGLGFLANGGVGVYHAGAEWGFWPGPSSCTGAQELTSSAGSMLEALSKTTVIRCDVAAVRVLGLSLAGWNAVASFFIAAMSLRSAAESTRAQ